jgi:hypothetical protein
MSLGIWFLDLWFGIKNGTFVDAHWFVRGTLFIETLLEVWKFLDNHTGEFIIVNI